MMGTKTFIPAFEAKVGSWTYYVCLMKYGQVAREIEFAHDIGGNQDLGTMIQRGIGVRTKEITEYLLTNQNRFLGSLIVAVWGGHPEYTPLVMSAEAESQEMLRGIDRNFGVLTFDGTHRYFALDGQHRLKAIKDAVKQDSDLVDEDISVIVVPHFDTQVGRRRTRRLFTNINRNVKTTTAQENLALDEDDGFAILTRRLLDEHELLRRDGVVRVFTRQGQQGDLRLANRQIPANTISWTTIGVLYDIIRSLGFDLHHSMYKQSQRATDEVLDSSYEIIAKRLDDLMESCGNWRERYNSGSPKDLRAPKGRDGEGHAFMRPVVQVQVSRVVQYIMERDLLDWDHLMARLSSLDWRISAPPFSAVWLETPDAPRKGKMITAKENTQLLHELLISHLAPSSKVQITRALRSYRDLKKESYPVAVETLLGNAVSKSVSDHTGDLEEGMSGTAST